MNLGIFFFFTVWAKFLVINPDLNFLGKKLQEPANPRLVCGIFSAGGGRVLAGVLANV